jgi:hypothetical protein
MRALMTACVVGAALFVVTCVSYGQMADSAEEDLTIWPNSVSKANSDPWIVENHDKIRLMKPKVLVLNFCNGWGMDKAREKADQLVAALKEGSRYHGFEDPKAPAFLEYQIVKLVDLRDKDETVKTPDGNSTRYPRVPNWKPGSINFQYKQLYSQEFAENYGYKDPRNPKRYLMLHELVDRGIINELWFFAYQKEFGAPFECTELKPCYDENFKRIPDKYAASGNGGDPEEPWHGRSLRINFINCERGIGCSMESLSHAIEGMAHSGVIPYFRKYFYEFAGFDLGQRYGIKEKDGILGTWPDVPVREGTSFYALWGEGKRIEYPDPETAVIKQPNQPDIVLHPYCAVGGNVHFTPNGRGHYDLENKDYVMSTIEHYRRFDGPDGKDIAEKWSNEKFAKYRDLAPDGMGPWLVYWRQCFPGLDNKSKLDDGTPMKNWWPFLFY